MLSLTKLFLSTVIIFFSYSLTFSKDMVSLKWLELVPKNAYSFVPETGVTEEMWEDETFLNKVEEAGILINNNILGKKLELMVLWCPSTLTMEKF